MVVVAVLACLKGTENWLVFEHIRKTQSKIRWVIRKNQSDAGVQVFSFWG